MAQFAICAHRKFRAFSLIVSMCRSGTYMSRGLAIGRGSRLSGPWPPCLASSPRPGTSGKASSSPETVFRSAVRSIRLLDDQVNDAARALDLATAAEHRGAEDRSAVLLEDGGPDDEIGVRGFVFQGDEHDALGGARHLANQHQPRNGNSPSVRRVAQRRAGQIAARLPGCCRRNASGCARRLNPLVR